MVFEIINALKKKKKKLLPIQLVYFDWWLQIDLTKKKNKFGFLFIDRRV